MKILEIKDSIITIPSEKGHFINQKVVFDKKMFGAILKTNSTKTYVLVDNSTQISLKSKYTIAKDE